MKSSCNLLALGVLLAVATPALAGPSPTPTSTPSATPTAIEGVCDDLMFATPGLYGLCVAFCEAQDCEPDFSLDDPFEQCTPSSPKVLEAYDKRKGEGDPEMPCVQTGCPCWSLEELAALPFPGEIKDGRPACIHREGMLDLWAVLARRDLPLDLPFIGVVTFKVESNENPLIVCEYLQRVVEPFEYRQFVITHDEYATCTADVIASGLERDFDCWPEP